MSNYKRFSLRFDLDAVNDRLAWEYIHREGGTTSVRRSIIDAINHTRKNKDLLDGIREMLREELSKVSIKEADTEGGVNSSDNEHRLSSEEKALNDALAMEFMSNF